MAGMVKIPLDKSGYSIYVNGKITDKVFLEEYGTLIEFEGTAVIFYSYSNHRRVYVMTEMENPGLPLLKGKLPMVKDEMTIIYEGRSRHIDLMKFTLYNLEKKFGSDIYLLPISYWLDLSSLVDGTVKGGGRRLRRFTMTLTERYLRRNRT